MPHLGAIKPSEAVPRRFSAVEASQHQFKSFAGTHHPPLPSHTHTRTHITTHPSPRSLKYRSPSPPFPFPSAPSAYLTPNPRRTNTLNQLADIHSCRIIQLCESRSIRRTCRYRSWDMGALGLLLGVCSDRACEDCRRRRPGVDAIVVGNGDGGMRRVDPVGEVGDAG
jgi:hypothetical protein